MTGIGLRRESDPAVERLVNIVQGEFFISDEDDVVLTTLLGSCVAACLRDPVAGVGGMNHFLLPGKAGSDELRYGVHAMELLVNGLLQRGARRDRLEAKLFGGARLTDTLADIGQQNAVFAERFLCDEAIRFAGGSLRGGHARRIRFWPVCGRARQIFLSKADVRNFAAERRPRANERDDGVVELFR